MFHSCRFVGTTIKNASCLVVLAKSLESLNFDSNGYVSKFKTMLTLSRLFGQFHRVHFLITSSLTAHNHLLYHPVVTLHNGIRYYCPEPDMTTLTLKYVHQVPESQSCRKLLHLDTLKLAMAW